MSCMMLLTQFSCNKKWAMTTLNSHTFFRTCFKKIINEYCTHKRWQFWIRSSIYWIISVEFLSYLKSTFRPFKILKLFFFLLFFLWKICVFSENFEVRKNVCSTGVSRRILPWSCSKAPWRERLSLCLVNIRIDSLHNLFKLVP